MSGGGDGDGSDGKETAALLVADHDSRSLVLHTRAPANVKVLLFGPPVELVYHDYGKDE